MEYPHVPYDEIELRYFPPTRGNEADALSLLELIRSVLLSQSDPTASLDVKEISQRIAAKYSYLVPGKKLRWEKTLKEVLRRHYCFTGHTQNGRVNLAYSCDPFVDPALKHQHAIKRKATSVTPSSGDACVPSGADSSQLPSPLNETDSGTVILASDTNLELVATEAYEQMEGAENSPTFYCQKVGPCLLRRRRWDGQMLTSDLVKLFTVLCGATPADQSLKQLFGLLDEDSWPETISREIARNAFNKARLRLPASAILDDAYPDLPNEAPPFVPRQQNWHTCRYCGQEFPGRAYRDHHVETRGTCQLEQPLQLRSYLEVLQSAAEAEEDPCALDDDTHSDGDEDGESDSHEYARAIISSAFISWTEGETDKFFYALRRFSRFRPDAIAEHIRTKNESEVIALLELLEEESARLDLGAADVRAQAAPAARKMSQAWIDMEERLAEDAVVWEAFVSQAIRTPPAMRDMVQKAITAERTPFSCLRCSLQTSPICDGRQPTCATCQRKGVHCSWRAGSLERRNVSDPELVVAIEAAYPDYKAPVSQQHAIREEFSQSLSWHHLLCLSVRPGEGPLKTRLELLWWKAASSVMRNFQDADLTHSTQPSTHGGYRRQSVMKALMHAELQDIDVLEKEAVFQYLKRGRHGKNSGPLFGNNLAALRAMPEVAAIHEDLKDTVSHEKDSPDRHLSGFRVRKAVRWVDKPIAHVSAELKDRFPEFEGVHEEFQQARLQLRTLRFTSDDLGQDAGLFHLRNIAAFLDLYRKDTETTACIQKETLQELYELVKSHTRRLLALALNLADIKGVEYSMSRCSPSENFVSCIEEAHLALKAHCKIPHLFKAFVQSAAAVSKRGYASKRASTAPATSDSRLQAVTGEKTALVVSVMDEYSLHPVEYTCLDSWEPDLVLDASEQSSEDQSSDSDSDSDSSSDEELLWADQQADARLDEGDRLEDAIYEQKLWESINIDAQGHVLSDQDESSSSNNMSEDDLLASSEEDAEMGGGRSGTESEEDGEAAIAPEDERPSKRMRMFSDASGQGSIATGFRDDRKRRKSYRTKEFISTSDEEEDA